MQGNNATKSMGEARLPRHVYEASREKERSCLRPRGRYSGSARIGEWKPRVLVLFVPQLSQSNNTSNLFFHQSFIPQLRDCHTGVGGIDSLLGQDQKLIAILFVAENERDEKAVADVLYRHDAILGT